ncbi:MAG: hypothetical protein RLZZ241_1447 [Bacteroidota bacterium]
MRRLISALVLILGWLNLSAQQQNAVFSIDPLTFGANTEITVTVTGVNPAPWGVSDVYIWAWYFSSPGASATDSPTNGTWQNSNEAQKMTANSDGSFSFTFTPATLFNTAGIDRMGLLVKAKDGTGDKKTQDFVTDVGGYQVTLTSPATTVSILNPGENLEISAVASEASDFTLLLNGTIIDSQNNSVGYQFSYIPTGPSSFELQATNGTEQKSILFQAYTLPQVEEAPLPTGLLDGSNVDPTDPSRVTLVLYAPGKEFVHVIGDFNNWLVSDPFLMKHDSAKDRFWIELTGLTPQYNHLYQYLVEYNIPIADPYSTLVLDGYGNDSFIESTTYPNLPQYPTGQTEAVTVLRTGDAPYNWQHPDFVPPARDDLVIYELLVRDFDARHSFAAVEERLDYLEELGINAIELMPVNEFDGNESWGYNPAFHMALDKYYGTADALKSLIDACHARGIAVLLDVVYNQATGQHPYFRMWNNCEGCTGGQVAPENPFFNINATHTYSVFNDFNHQSQATRDYVNRTVRYWIDEFHIDGMRWDLTKGFTQNCNPADYNCTNTLQSDRVAVLKQYADTQWASDSDFLVIFEHLGEIPEESQWANYRIDEGKGILLWNKQTDPFNEASMGYHDGGRSNFGGVSWKTKGFSQPSALSYMESHDEERLMYKNLNFGRVAGTYSVKNLATALKRMQAAGAFFFAVPGPKMIWQFGELGYDYSIDYNGRLGNKPIRWDYLENPNRAALHDQWRNLIQLKKFEPVFRTSDFTLDLGATSGLKTVKLSLPNPVSGKSQYLTLIANFGVQTQDIYVDFQTSGVWYEWLKNNLKFVVPQTQQTITLAPGEFRLFGSAPTALFPDDNPADADSDGIPDDLDTCPDTPLGKTVDVYGCEIFGLDPENFKVQAFSATCRGASNGSIAITADQDLAYSADLTGENVSATIEFSTTTTFNNLKAGAYELCIYVTGTATYSQCFNLDISEPDALQVSGSVNPITGKFDLDLAGGMHYFVSVNNKHWTTSEQTFSIPLEEGLNDIEIRTDLDCQGIYSKQLLYGSTYKIGQNPVKDGLLRLAFEPGNTPIRIQIFTMQGQSVMYVTPNPEPDLLNLNVGHLATGMYLLLVEGEQFTIGQTFMIE